MKSDHPSIKKYKYIQPTKLPRKGQTILFKVAQCDHSVTELELESSLPASKALALSLYAIMPLFKDSCREVQKSTG